MVVVVLWVSLVCNKACASGRSSLCKGKQEQNPLCVDLALSQWTMSKRNHWLQLAAAPSAVLATDAVLVKPKENGHSVVGETMEWSTVHQWKVTPVSGEQPVVRRQLQLVLVLFEGQEQHPTANNHP